MHFDVNRRSTSPTAMGLRPPFFFFTDSKVAPQRYDAISGGASPAARRLTVAVIALRARVPQLAVGQQVVSLRWLALRREGPGAESEGNDRRARTHAHRRGTEIGGVDGREGGRD